MDNCCFWNKKVFFSWILAVLVMFIHNPSYPLYFNMHLCGFETLMRLEVLIKSISQLAVPGFFVLSSALFFRNYAQCAFFEKLKSRFYSLVIPYLSWNIIWLVFSIVITLFFSNYFQRDLFDFSIGSFIRAIFFYGQNPPFWFIADLIIFICLSPILYAVLKCQFVAIVSLLIIIVVTSTSFIDLGTYLWDNSSFFYYMFGGFIGVHYKELLYKEKLVPYSVSIPLFVVCGICLYFFTFSFFTHGMKTAYFNELTNINPNLQSFLFIISKLLMVICLWSIIDAIKFTNKNLFHYSFWIYAIHFNIQSIFSKLFFMGFPQISLFAPITHFLSTFATVLFVYLSVYIVKKNKLLYRVLSGNRE